MAKIVKALDKIMKYVIVVLSLSMVITIFAQVFTRYVLKTPLSWSEELARYLFTWITFLGAAVAVGKKSHVIIDFVVRYFPERLSLINEIVVSVIMGVYLVIIIYSSSQLLPMMASSITPALQISYNYVYAAIPVSGVVTFIYLIDNVINDIVKLRKNSVSETSKLSGRVK